LMNNNNIFISINAGTQMTVQGTIVNNAGTLISNSGTIDLSGDWINNSGTVCFGASQGTVILNGANQDIKGTNSTRFCNLTLAGSGTKTLQVLTAVCGLPATGVLDVGSRTLDLNSHQLQVSNSSTGAITYSTGIILSEKTDNSSNVLWAIGSTTGPHAIPFGNISGVQIPLTIDLTSGNIGNVIASTYPTAPDNTPFPTTPTLVTTLNDQNGVDNSANTVDRFWEIDKSIGAATADLTFTYAPLEAPANGNVNLRAQRWNSPVYGWDLPIAGQYNPSANAVYVPSVGNFGAWTLSLEDSPLPISLLSFDARAVNKKEVAITWITESEINNDYFTVERSKDGINFSEIEKVNGAGNSTVLLHYATMDMHPLNGVSYYRLRQTDYNGLFTFSEIKSVIIYGEGANSVFVYPNPATTSTYILFNELPEHAGDIRFELFDATGNKIAGSNLFELEAVSENSFRFNRGTLANGIYFYTVSSGDSNLSRGKITFQ